MSQCFAEKPTDTRPLIVIADDDPDIRFLLKVLLSDMGQVLDTGNGAEALRLTREHRPALLVCDHEMEGLRGGSVALALRDDPELAGTQVILISGYAAEEVLDSRLEGAVFLQKPFTARELTELAHRTLRETVAG